MYKKILCVLIAFVFSVSTVSAGTVYFNGIPVGSGVDYIERDGYVYLPLRKLADLFGGELGWDDKSKTVTIYNPMSSKKEILAEVTVGSKTATIYPIGGGDPYETEMEAPPIIVDSRTFLPYDFILESIGFSGELDKKTGDIRLKGSM